MPNPEYPDYLTDIRNWMRSNEYMNPIHEGRVFFRVPPVDRLSGYPVMRVYQSSTFPASLYVPELIVRVGVQMWTDDNKGYAALRRLKQAYESACFALEAGRLFPQAQTYAFYAEAEGTHDSPDPLNGWPRIVSTLSMKVRLAGDADP